MTTSGTHNSVSYNSGDWILYNGSEWQKLELSSNTVSSFNGRRGVVVPLAGDYSWSQITKTGSKLEDIANVNVTRRNNGDFLQWDAGSNTWITKEISMTLENASVGTAQIADSVVTYQKLNLSDGDIPLAKVNGLVSALNDKEPSLPSGAATQYLRGDKTFVTLDTSVVPENGNLYFTTGRALNAPLTGLTTSNAAISAADTILGAFGKIQGQINQKMDSSTFVDWSTSGLQTIDPSRLSLGVGGADQVLVSDGDGSITASSVSSSELGYLSGVTSSIQTQLNNKQDKIDASKAVPLSKVRIYGENETNYVELSTGALSANRVLNFPDSNGTSGQFLSTDGAGNLSWASAAGGVTSVNSLTGVVTLSTSNIAEGNNLYFTNDRAVASTIGAPTLTTAAIASGDSLQVVAGKLQGQITPRNLN